MVLHAVIYACIHSIAIQTLGRKVYHEKAKNPVNTFRPQSITMRENDAAARVRVFGIFVKNHENANAERNGANEMAPQSAL